MKKIAIIGGGFYGCYIAKKLKDKFKSKIRVDIFEKNKSLILEAGKNNQYKFKFSKINTFIYYYFWFLHYRVFR